MVDCKIKDNIPVYYVTNIGQLQCFTFFCKNISHKVQATSSIKKKKKFKKKLPTKTKIEIGVKIKILKTCI